MKIFLGSDENGFRLKKLIKEYLIQLGYEIIDLSKKPATDFIDSSIKVTKEVLKDKNSRGILFDETGSGSFITSVKFKGAVVAQVSDERSAYMTRAHNDTRIITIGSEIIGDNLAKNIVKSFLESHYDSGRHQVRVDMLNAMC